ncbi:hypothetical protein GA0070624_1662 [Micromonospora rhizosphaerae]|uniref:Uncharacterized protein n=1 Tax=Micromonospora rhizosphaerae TaxID=568872 RepID=A0A1C6RP93_9ACTN|nr:hypothetical protein [Micromonospora rhizosphaerae]SCL19017.1 hypothetical protein GA0070624_1662 [Micromonospora rhizosphaerae]
MRDDLTFAERLRRDLRDVRWAEPAEIRARARRRTRRAVVAAAAAVLAVVSSSAYAAAGRSATPAPPVAATPASTVTAAPAEIPQEALLIPRDVPLKTGVRLGETGLGETVRVDPVLESCGRDRGVPSTEPTSRYSRSQTLLRAAADRTAAPGPVLTQDVYRIDPDRSRLLFGTVSLLLDACAEWQHTGSVVLAGRTVPTVSTHRWETPITNFAGDESVMLRHVSLAPRSRADGTTVAATPPIEVSMVVRVGDLVTVIATGPDTLEDTVDGPRRGPGLSYADLAALGRTAAGRMCPAANPPC